VEPKAAVADLLAWWLRPERSRLGCRIYIYIYIYYIVWSQPPAYGDTQCREFLFGLASPYVVYETN
jgi:hypothetical protein